MLPGMSGYAVCETLREQGNDVPVLILSARTLTEDRIRGMDVGADQYLEKPFDLDELLAMVRNSARAGDRGSPCKACIASSANEFEFGRARINFDTFKVTVDGKSLRLTHDGNEAAAILHRERRLGHQPLAAAGRCVGIVRQPHDADGRQFYRSLAAVLRSGPSAPATFLSVRGAGYRFVSAKKRKREEEEA